MRLLFDLFCKLLFWKKPPIRAAHPSRSDWRLNPLLKVCPVCKGSTYDGPEGWCDPCDSLGYITDESKFSFDVFDSVPHDATVRKISSSEALDWGWSDRKNTRRLYIVKTPMTGVGCPPHGYSEHDVWELLALMGYQVSESEPCGHANDCCGCRSRTTAVLELCLPEDAEGNVYADRCPQRRFFRKKFSVWTWYFSQHFYTNT